MPGYMLSCQLPQYQSLITSGGWPRWSVAYFELVPSPSAWDKGIHSRFRGRYKTTSGGHPVVRLLVRPMRSRYLRLAPDAPLECLNCCIQDSPVGIEDLHNILVRITVCQLEQVGSGR